MDLEEILNPGGGQADSWHHLNIKGRYAGEIRIELTYYDSRPKPERPRKQSNADMMQQDGQPRAAGPRQPVTRRPLPSTSETPPYQQSPSADAADRSPSISVPPTVPRSYHTPPRQHAYSDSYTSGSYPPQDGQLQHYQQPAGHDFSRSLPRPGEHDNTYDPYDQYAPANGDQWRRSRSRDQQDFYMEAEASEDQSYYPNEPYAVQPYDDRNNGDYDYYAQQAAPPTARHDRVQRLSASPAARPSPPSTMVHAHSAPQLEPHELAHDYSNQQYETEDWNSHDGRGQSPHETNGHYSSPDHPYRHQQSRHLGGPGPPSGYSQQSHPSPPPPPIHRNSAPIATTRSLPRPTLAQHSTPPSRALHVSTTTDELPGDYPSNQSYGRSPPGHYQDRSPLAGRQLQESQLTQRVPPRSRSGDDYTTNYAGGRPAAYPSHLAQNAAPAVRPRDELSYDPRREYVNSNERAEDYSNQPQPINIHRPRPISYAGHTNSSPNLPSQAHYSVSPPSSRPQPTTPSSRPSASAFTTPRKSISPHPSPQQVNSTNAYSPDSFGELNPSHSHSHLPNAALARDPTPMYAPQSKPQPSHTHSQSQPDLLAKQPLPTDSINPDGTITTTTGLTKDASDHLPASSYAPEPERKGGDKIRPSTRINIQNRFGPRDAGNGGITIPTPASGRPTASAGNSPSTSSPSTGRPVSMPSSEQRDRLYRRGDRISGSGGGSPLTPTDPSTLNYDHRYNSSYTQNDYAYSQNNYPVPSTQNQSSPYPPPIPAKLPLSQQQNLPLYRPGRQNSLEDYEPGGNMQSLAADLKMVNFKGDDEVLGGGSESGGSGGKLRVNGAGRMRKAKWSG